jgi:hypothetical protein
MPSGPLGGVVSLTNAWTPLRHHATQAALWRTQARFPVVVAGRGSGKTELARRRVVRFLNVVKPWPDPKYFYALPTYTQAKRVAWDPLKALVPKRWIRKISESELFIETIYGSRLYLFGMDKPERAEGVQWDGGIMDECSDQKPGVFHRSLYPAFSHRRAWCWRIGVPKRYGCGAAEFKSAFEKGLKGLDEHAAFTWPSSDIISREDATLAMGNLDALDYAEQFGALWQSVGGGIFHAWDERYNRSEIACYRPDLPVIVGSDFNVNPMCWTLSHSQDNRTLHVFDEIVLRDTNTAATLADLYKRLGGHQSGWVFCGDATGQSRKTSAAESDYLQIRNAEQFVGRRVLYPRSNPSVVDRFAATNAMLCNAAGERRLFVHPRCTRLIADFEQRRWKDGARESDDYGDLGHMSDALGYVIDMLFPLEYNFGNEIPKVYAG